MDFTSVCLETLPRGALRTTVGFEPALAVLFTSDIQHYAAIFVGMAKMPAFMKTLLKEIPAAWHDFKFQAGFPGKEVGMASKNPAARVYVLLMPRVLLLIRRQRGAGSMLGGVMNDLHCLLLITGFFLLCLAYLRGCERLK